MVEFKKNTIKISSMIKVITALLLPTGLVDTMKQGESANWSFNPEQFADLASSLNNFFTQVGSNSPRQNVSQQYDSLAGN